MDEETIATSKAVQALLKSELDMYQQGLLSNEEYFNKTVATLQQGLVQLLS